MCTNSSPKYHHFLKFSGSRKLFSRPVTSWVPFITASYKVLYADIAFTNSLDPDQV